MSDDDDSESDIETMFQDAHNNIVRKTDEQLDDDDSDNSDNGDHNQANKALGTPHHFGYSSTTKKRKKSAVDKKLEVLSQRKAKQQEIDKVNSCKLQRMDNDDDDFLDDDDVKVVGTTSAPITTSSSTTMARNGMATRSAITAKPPNYVEPSITLLDSDDEEDDNAPVAGGVTTQRNGTAITNQMYSATIPPSYLNHFINIMNTGASQPNLQQQQQHQPHLPTVMNPSHAATIRGRLVPNMILPPVRKNQRPPNPAVPPHLLSASSMPLSQQYQQLQQQRLRSTVANMMNTIDVDAIVASNQSTGAQLLRLEAIATIIPSQRSSAPSLAGLPVVDLTSDIPTSSYVSQIKGSKTVSCTVDIIETSTVQVLMDRILEHYLRLNLKQNVIGLQFNNAPLNAKHTLDMYGIPVSGATIVATVHSSDTATIHHTNNGSSIGNTNASGGRTVNASSFATIPPRAHVPKGTVLNLLLRRSWTRNGKTSCDEISLTIGSLDPLQILVDKYRRHSQEASASASTAAPVIHPNHQITLQFDGDTILLQRTPQQYEMENDDLIDVMVT